MKKSTIGAVISGAVLAATAGFASIAQADTTYNDLDATIDTVGRRST